MRQVGVTVLAILLMVGAAAAQDKASATCGKTVDECQAKVTDLASQIVALRAALQTAISQRTTADNAAVDASYSATYQAQKLSAPPAPTAK